MALSFGRFNNQWVKGYDSSDLGITPGVTVVGAAAFEAIIDFRGFKEFAGQINYVLGIGCTLRVNWIPLRKDGVTAMGPGMYVAGIAGGTALNFQFNPALTNNGQWENGAGNGTFNNAGQIPLCSAEYMLLRIERTAGANDSTLGITQLFLRG